ncbi:5'-nucleotidase/2',3'-cyclic phosphodiesterase and related esterase [Candidatus Scalindua japonica]|uniref:5'-nucleotidase/2',3'-cyclic phosphodiesterase and related esterase n=1 Tax=Candidatus Scalindua japonica TaxID=1284222 RepID=A0A286TWE8_9BACT|nr:bifunctional metallophosphatase/5'-nucleotidase [Candidatus Scalindua japonica]GAX60206.1 5'-nucleotidase/2',3'-cyclic phosphodiesterase and related esterase [Candidatus Scalindua japonica]
MKKMRVFNISLAATFVCFLLSLFAAMPGLSAGDVVKITLLHFNDVYEIDPVSGGTQGGLARVATLKKRFLKENPNTYAILAGDLFSPSALGTAPYKGGRLDGRQMVATLNTLGLDFVTFGNHEFDLNKDSFYKRLSESNATWISSNVFDEKGNSFPGVSENKIIVVTDDSGKKVRIGLFGVTLAGNQKPYVSYKNPIDTARKMVERLRSKVDILIAVTHLAIEEDMRIAKELPDIDLILGGHEHENIQVWRGLNFTPISKADANARTVYVHELFFNTDKMDLEIVSRIRFITSEIPDDPKTAKVIKRWRDAGYKGFRRAGFEPENMVVMTTESLDGLESSVRNNSTRLTELIGEGMQEVSPGAELAIFNGGSVRIDDVIPPGKVTEYDILRIMPFGGDVLSVKMKGSLLKRVLDQGRKNRGTGGYLQTINVILSNDGSTWQITGIKLKPEKIYNVAINDFLLTGKEIGLDYLTEENKDISDVGNHGDMRKALIAILKKMYGGNR